MNTLKTLFGNDKPTIPDAIIASMTEKELQFMSAWNGQAAHSEEEKKVHEQLLKTLTPYLGPMSATSRRVILEALQDRKSGRRMIVANPEQSLWKTGGAAYYDKDSMIMLQGSGEVTVVPNTIIPDGVGRRRQGLVPMTVMMCSMIKVSQGEMTLLHEPRAFHGRWSGYCPPFRPFRFIEVLAVFKRAVAEDPQWKAVADTEATVTNDRLVSLIYELLVSMNDLLYYYLHTMICFELLCIFDPTTANGMKYSLIRTKVNAQFAVQEKAYTVMETGKVPATIERQIREMGYPAVVIYRGGITPNIKVARETDMAAAVAAKSMSLATRGSDKSAMSFLCRNSSYSGLSTEEVRTLQRCVAMVGGVIKAGHPKVDVEISSVGHVSILYTSLTHHFPNDDWVLFMSTEQYLKSSAAAKSRIQTDRRPDSHLVRYSPFQMRSHSLKKKDGAEEMIQVSIKNYHEDSTKWAPHAAYSGYTIYTTLFGYYPWAKPGKQSTSDETESSTSSTGAGPRSFNPRQLPPRPHFVYKFGQIESFCGIVSTIPKMALFGQACVVKKSEADSIVKTRLQFSEQMVPLVQVDSEANWYGRVINANAAMESYWMHAAPKFSPVSNVLRIPKTGAIIEYNSIGEMVLVDQDEYVEVAQEEGDRVTREMDQSLVQKGFDLSIPLEKLTTEEEDSEDDEEESNNSLQGQRRPEKREYEKQAPVRIEEVPKPKMPIRQKRNSLEKEVKVSTATTSDPVSDENTYTPDLSPANM